jgi:flagellar protein FliL
MAKAKAADAESDNTGVSNLLVVFILLTVIASGAGAGGGWFLFRAPAKEPAVETKMSPSKPIQFEAGFPADAIEVPLEPILAKLKGSDVRDARIELSLVMTGNPEQLGLLKTQVAEDVVAFLSGITPSDLEGSRGFLNLLDDLEERAISRGQGAIVKLFIRGFAIQ